MVNKAKIKGHSGCKASCLWILIGGTLFKIVLKKKKLGSVSVSAMSGTEEKLNFIDMKSASKEKFQCTDKVLNGGMKENGSP